MFANGGAIVSGVDIDPNVVSSVSRGVCHFKDEPGLEELMSKEVAEGRLKAFLEYAEPVSHADFIVVSVPTPVSESKVPDYSAVKSAAREIGRSLQKGSVVIVESTVGPGTVEDLVQPILEKESGLKAGSEFGLASCPERSDPGSIMKNMVNVPRVVGATTPQCCDVVAELYRAAFGVNVVKLSSPKTANAVKLTENLFRDVNIALANEFALLFEKLGIDTIEVIDACATKYNFMPHYPGSGVGGPCLPSNPYYLITEGLKVGNIPYIIRLAREINDRMPDHVVELALEAMNDVGQTARGAKVAVLGASYKPNVKDIQLSPIEKICDRLRLMGSSLRLYDPMFHDEVVFGIRVSPSLEEAVKDADCIIIGTAHDEFRKCDPNELKRLASKRAALVDSRQVFDPESVRKAGFAYRGVGRTNTVTV
jgi:nucleotide sugar dehydrogenase